MEDSPIHLNCSFKRSCRPFMVHWLKMNSEKGSPTFISSYNSMREPTSTITHCACGRKGCHWHSHDTRIGNSLSSDSGVYVCVLQRKKNYAQMKNKTERKERKKSRKNTQDHQRQTDTDENETDSDDECGEHLGDEMEEGQRGRSKWIEIRRLTVNVKRRDGPNKKPPSRRTYW